MTDGTGPGGPEGSALLVAAFRGWNDAADSASDAVAHLAEAWGAEVVHEVDPEPYYDFQVNRPEAVVGEDGARELVWPGTRVLRAEVGGRVVLLVDGTEPSMRWRGFCAELLAGGPRPRRAARPHPGRAAHRRARTPARSRSASPRRSRRGPRRGAWSCRATRARPASSACSSTRRPPPGCPGCRCGRRSRTTSPSRPTPSRRSPCSAGSRTSPAWSARSASCARRPTPGSAASTSSRARTRRSPSTSRQLEQARDTADLPEASGEAIAREFEKYLRRRER